MANVCADRKLSQGQREALVQASKSPLLILTGGPGCGKTVATAQIVKLWRAQRRELGLAAPTGVFLPAHVCGCAEGPEACLL